MKDSDKQSLKRYRSSGSLQTMTSSQFYSTNNLFVNSPGLSSNISSSTLQHTAPQHSFPKANRFFTQSQVSTPHNVELPSSLGQRTTSQGFGRRVVYQFQWQKRRAEEMPSPDKYEVRQEPGSDKQMKSFGLPWDAYSKTYIPYNKHQAPEISKFLPGPGEYQVRKDIGVHRYKYMLKGKGKMCNDIKDNGVPGPDAYSPLKSLVTPSRFSKISQGIGAKKDPFLSTSFTPGPGKYELSSAFEKATKKRELYTREKRPFI